MGMKQMIVQKKQLSPQAVRQDASRSSEVQLHLDAGQVLFAQGDGGGDLYFIESGAVDIFISKKEQDIVLAQMGPGEVIGVMTLLTSEPRLASARAKEATIVKKIHRTAISKLISSFPKWLNIVLKEFTIRINEMNRRYSDTLIELKRVRQNQITPLFLASQMSQSLVIVGRGIAKNMGGQDIVFVDDLLEKMERVLNQPREVTAGLWQVLQEAGLIDVDIEPDRKRKVVSLNELDKVGAFAQFVRDSGQGAGKKILKAKFRYKELLALIGLVKHVIKQGADPGKSGTFDMANIEPQFEKITGMPWNACYVEKPSKLGLLLAKGSGETMTLTFTPSVLGQTLGCVAAMKKFLGDEDSETEADASPEYAASPSDLQNQASARPPKRAS
jgi:CRP-like cAMP-binding protein